MFDVKKAKKAYDESNHDFTPSESFFREYSQQVYEMADYNAKEADRWLEHCKWFATYSAIATFMTTIFAVLLLTKPRR